VVVGAVAQLAVAIVIALHQGTRPLGQHQVTMVAPADAVRPEMPGTTTTAPPVVVEVTTTTKAPPTTAAPIATGAVYGVIGAGAGGKARADLRDGAGNTWHSEADRNGASRFDQLPAGRYQLILTAESGVVPCPPGGSCIGTAMAIARRVIDIRPGQEIREDYPVYGPTRPAEPTTTTSSTAPPPSTPVPPSTSTTIGVVPR
jgi:hypothetical protein